MNEPRIVPINSIKTDEIGEQLTNSPNMQPYIRYWIARENGQDPKACLEAIRALPLEKRYLWRVASALAWALADFDNETLKIDLATLSPADVTKTKEFVQLRPAQFRILVETLKTAGFPFTELG